MCVCVPVSVCACVSMCVLVFVCVQSGMCMCMRMHACVCVCEWLVMDGLTINRHIVLQCSFIECRPIPHCESYHIVLCCQVFHGQDVNVCLMIALV